MIERKVKLLRRRVLPSGQAKLLRAGAIEMDLERAKVWIGGEPVELTEKEFELLRLLMETKGEVLTREFLLEKIWGNGKRVGIDSRTIDVHIHRLRQKLGSEGDHILTVKNVGYRVHVFFNWIKFGA